jgi:hypothetical protein
MHFNIILYQMKPNLTSDDDDIGLVIM